MKSFLRFLIGKSESKEETTNSQPQEGRNHSLEAKKLWEEEGSHASSLSPPQEFYKEEIRSLPSAAFAAFRMCGLTEEQVLKDWDIFMRCVYYCTPKKTFAKAPPIINSPFQPSKSASRPRRKSRTSHSHRSHKSTSSSENVSVAERRATNTANVEEKGNESHYESIQPESHYEHQDCMKDSKLNLPMGQQNYSNYTLSDELILAHRTNNIENRTAKHTHVPDSGSHYTTFDDLQTSPSPVPSKTPENTSRKNEETKESSSRKKKFSQEQLNSMITNKSPSDLFILSRQAGKGSFGKVYVAIRRADKKKFAVKVVKKSWSEDPQTTAQEISLLSSCHHPNIVGYTESYLWNDQIWMVMDYCDAGTLNELLVVDLNENQIACIISQVLQGLNYLHRMQRIHRDIKSHNILMNMNGDVKVADLGLCIEAEESTSMAGSKYWIAPEVITGRYNNKADIWSTGALIVEMAEGSAPYSKYKALKAMFLTATKGAPSLQNPEKWSETFKDFLRLCFTMEADRRPSADFLLSHPFLKNASSRKELIKTMKLVFLLRVTTGI